MNYNLAQAHDPPTAELVIAATGFQLVDLLLDEFRALVEDVFDLDLEAVVAAMRS